MKIFIPDTAYKKSLGRALSSDKPKTVHLKRSELVADEDVVEKQLLLHLPNRVHLLRQSPKIIIIMLMMMIMIIIVP